MQQKEFSNAIHGVKVGLILFLKEENKEDFYEKLTIYFSLILTLLLITGCIRRDDLENIKITTTIEPITYLTYELYGDYAEIESIYGNDSEKLEINNEKILENIKQSRIFIYNGLNELETNLTKTLVQEGYHKKLHLLMQVKILEILEKLMMLIFGLIQQMF